MLPPPGKLDNADCEKSRGIAQLFPRLLQIYHDLPRFGDIARQSRAGIFGIALGQANCFTTASASDSDAVSPGDSMPNRLTSRGRPWSAGPAIKKSA